MIDWQGLRDTTGVSILLDVGCALGMARAASLAGSQIDPSSLDEPLASITAWQELALIRNLQAFCGNDQALGLTVASHYNTATLGVLGQAMAACDTLQQALDLTARYRWFGLSFSRYELQVEADELRVFVDDDDVPSDCQRFCQERGLGACVSLWSSLLQRPAEVTSVSMRQCEPANHSDYRDYFGAPVAFGEPHNLVCFDAGLLKQPLPGANKKIRLVSERYCDEVLAQQSRPQRWTARVRAAIEAQDLVVTVESIATTFGVSGRQLRRHLAREGTNFRELLLLVKMSRGQSLLKSGLSVEQVAQRLGYAETASFSRVFKARLGLTPRQFD